MSLLVIGSIALDSVETPVDKVDDALGGAATFISLTASYFTKPVQLVGVIGDDFPEKHIQMLRDRNIDLEGLEVIKGGKTFRWGGKYHPDMNDRDTIFTDLNVFEKFDPKIPEKFRNSEFVLLGNIDPELQMRVLKQMKNPKYVILDTMNLWINIKRQELLEVLKHVNALIINDSESKLLSGENNLVKAANIIRELGPETLIIKKGEHGALLFHEDKIFSVPAYPMEKIYDPTGAGDTFAGGFAGYLHKEGELSYDNLKKAVVYASVMGSFCVCGFSTKGIEDLNSEKIEKRYQEFVELTKF